MVLELPLSWTTSSNLDACLVKDACACVLDRVSECLHCLPVRFALCVSRAIMKPLRANFTSASRPLRSVRSLTSLIETESLEGYYHSRIINHAVAGVFARSIELSTWKISGWERPGFDTSLG